MLRSSFGCKLACVELADSLEDGLIGLVLEVARIRGSPIIERLLDVIDNFGEFFFIKVVGLCSADVVDERAKLFASELQIELELGETRNFSNESFS